MMENISHEEKKSSEVSESESKRLDQVNEKLEEDYPIKKKKNEIELYFKEKEERLIQSMEVDIDHYGSTNFMFFNIDYFDNNIENWYNSNNPNWPKKIIYKPWQFALINYYGMVCFSEWIRYDEEDLGCLQEFYIAKLKGLGINIKATI